MAHSGYRDATIPVEESISHVCADLRRRRYLQQPHVAVDYMTSVTGESLHPDLVNFDILAKKNYERFKARMLGEKTRSDYIEPSDKSVEKLSKAEEHRLKELQRASSKTKAALRELWDNTMGDVEDGYAASEE